MSPNSTTATETLPPIQKAKQKPQVTIVWRNVFIFSYLHLSALYGLYLAFTSAKTATNVFALFLYVFSGLGITAGAHRLWAHRSYKAKWPLRLLLTVMNTSAFQNDIYEWARDHRVHHKFSETDADPHNATRGFFFAHMGWLLVKKHPDVMVKGKTVSMSDLEGDKIVMFQRKYYVPLVLLFCFILPSTLPAWLWGDSYMNGYYISAVLRYVVTLHFTWLVNSAAHMWGNRPFDRYINPRENPFVVFGAIGEGFHNYHHTFPYDYSASEFGMKYNLTTSFINFFALFGLAYDRKTVSKEAIMSRRMKSGDGTHMFY